MKILIYLAAMSLTIIILFYFFGLKEDSFVFKISSKIIGHQPQSGDGAFHYPLAWIILILAGSLIGWIIAHVIQKYLLKP